MFLRPVVIPGRNREVLRCLVSPEVIRYPSPHGFRYFRFITSGGEIRLRAQLAINGHGQGRPSSLAECEARIIVCYRARLSLYCKKILRTSQTGVTL